VFKVHTSDGQTLFVDLKDEGQARDFLRRFRSEQEQNQITGVTVTRRCSGRFYCADCSQTSHAKCPRCGGNNTHCSKGAQFSLSRPEGFSKVFYQVEYFEPVRERKIRGGDKITCFVDDFRIEVMVHSDQPSTKVSLLRTGIQRYNPLTG
jgi:hypothetical protein